MNNYLDKVFDTPNKKAFIAFLTAGDPDADSTVKFILEMDKAGADLIEIGIPFSDPTAEGVVIQEANIRSLSNGMTTTVCLRSCRGCGSSRRSPWVYDLCKSRIPYGYEKFFTKCEELASALSLFPMYRMKRRQRWRLPLKPMA